MAPDDYFAIFVTCCFALFGVCFFTDSLLQYVILWGSSMHLCTCTLLKNGVYWNTFLLINLFRCAWSRVRAKFYRTADLEGQSWETLIYTGFLQFFAKSSLLLLTFGNAALLLSSFYDQFMCFSLILSHFFMSCANEVHLFMYVSYMCM